MKDFFIVGDVHGCFYTLMNLLKHWNQTKEHLIFVGDLIDRGNYSSDVIRYCNELNKKDNCTVLKGNHEQEFIEYFENGSNDNWINQCGKKTIEDFASNQLKEAVVYDWLNRLPLKYETAFFIVTHAGISITEDPYDVSNMDGVLWTRKELVNIGKTQIHGHTPLLNNTPSFDKKSNSWNLDTGAFYGFGLTGLKINANGEKIEIINVETQPKDVN